MTSTSCILDGVEIAPWAVRSPTKDLDHGLFPYKVLLKQESRPPVSYPAYKNSFFKLCRAASKACKILLYVIFSAYLICNKRPARVTLTRITPTRFITSTQKLIFVNGFPPIIGLEPVLTRFRGYDFDLDLLQLGRGGDGPVGNPESNPTR